MTEYELFQALRPLYPAREYALLPQVANGTGFSVNRHADAIALSLWPSRGLHVSGFEMKSYRGDWIRELRNPEKAESIARYCHYWWIVAADDFVKEDELPAPWGLLRWDEKKSGLVKIKAAPFSAAATMHVPLIAAILRKSQEVVTPDGALAEARAEGLKEGRADATRRAEADKRDLEALRKKVRAFEKASGLKIDEGWNQPASVGEAVRLVLEGSANRYVGKLRELAASIIKDFGVEEAL